MEIPKCPRHPTSEVVRAGWYGAPGHRRQRWWCRPKRAEPHRFTETAPRICRHGAGEATCDVCATHLEPWEGQPSARLYGFTALEVASTLAHVAGGVSYRQAAANVRSMAGRELARVHGRKTPRGRHLRDPQHHGQLVSDWVDVFAPVLWEHYAPQVWPDYVMLDDSEYMYRPVKRVAGVKPPSHRAFIVHAAVGYVGGEPKVVAIAADRNKAISSWKAFLSSVPGQPKVVVGDRGEPIKAASALWGARKPPTLVQHCEWHLGKNLRDGVPAGTAPEDPIWRLISGAFADQTRWDALVAEASRRASLDRVWVKLDRVVGNMDAVVRAQVPYGAKMPGPTSTGPVENFLRELRPVIADRAHGFTNRKRTTALLYLVALTRNGWGTPNDWAKVIREHLEASKGHAPRQRRHVDPLNKPSLRPRSKPQRWTAPPPRPKGSTARPTR